MKKQFTLIIFFITFFFTSAQASFRDFAETFAGLAGVSPDEVVDGFNLVVDHGTCIPKYIPGDPEAYPLGALTMALKVARAKGYLAKDYNQCKQKINFGEKALTTFFAQSSKFMGFLSHDQQEQVKLSASQNMPGLSFLIELAECSCAVAVTDTPIDAQLKTINYGVEAAWDIYKLGGKLVMEAGRIISETGTAVINVANDIGCSLGLGGCSDWNPEAFYQIFKSWRNQGKSYEQYRSFFEVILNWGGLPSTAGYSDYLAECEARFQIEKAAELAKKLAAEEAAQLAQNQNIAASAAAGWAIIWAKMWAYNCKDDECAQNMVVVANQRAAEEADPATLAYYHGSTTEMKKAMNEKYNPRIALNHELSVGREKTRQEISDNPTYPAVQRLPLLGCRTFLGRATDYNCQGEFGFGACSNYVDQGSVQNCFIGGQRKKYADIGVVANELMGKGCELQPDNSRQSVPGRRPPKAIPAFYCGRPEGHTTCEDYRLGGVRLSCPQRPLIVVPPTVIFRPNPRIRPLPGRPTVIRPRPINL
jgi:hypothetical protein